MLLSRGDNVGTTFGGHHLNKIWEGKNVQNVVRFTTTFDFDREYLEKGTNREDNKRKMALSTKISLTSNKTNLVNFGPLTPEIMWLMFTNPKSTLCVLRMLMHLSLGHVTLLLGEFQP